MADYDAPMGTYSVASFAGGPNDVRVSWSLGVRDVRLEFQGFEVARAASSDALDDGLRATLVDGRVLEVRRTRSLFATPVFVTLGGVRLEPSTMNDGSALRDASWWMKYLVFTRLLIGVVQLATSSTVDGGFSLVVGAANAVGVRGLDTNSRRLFGVGATAFVFESILAIAGTAMSSGGAATVGGLVLRLFAARAFYRAWKAWPTIARADAVGAHTMKKVFE